MPLTRSWASYVDLVLLLSQLPVGISSPTSSCKHHQNQWNSLQLLQLANASCSGASGIFASARPGGGCRRALLKRFYRHATEFRSIAILEEPPRAVSIVLISRAGGFGA
ncbi:hypothetical protein BKA56DRAFT_592557 [Ilyonectria sp. MPI-CAGE-AT-0026]|nr:hypothetical protein BKA56DRAFT_592557 [Ilyonectria sp. MPI-CAGE-AT-0026]